MQVFLFDGFKCRAGSFIVGEGGGMVSGGLMVVMREGSGVVRHAMAKVTVLHFGCLLSKVSRIKEECSMQEE